MKINFLIPARGGSKRLPRKNIAILLGKPLILWSIEACMKSKYFNDNIFVSTEDEEIKNICKEIVKVIDRPNHLSNDNVWTQDVINHFVSYINSSNDDITVVVQANSPEVTSEKIDQAIEMLISNELWQVHSVGNDFINNGAIHVVRNFIHDHKGKANYNGIIVFDCVDIHYKSDLDLAEKRMHNKD